MRTVSGKTIQIYGTREVTYDVWDSENKKHNLKIRYIVADVRRAIISTSQLLDKGFGVVERTSGCYLEKGPSRVPFVRRSVTFVLMVRRRTSPATHGIFATEGFGVAMETFTQGASDRSMHIPVEIAEDRLAESLPVPERPSEEAVARHQLTHMPYAAWCHDCVAGRAVEDAH